MAGHHRPADPVAGRAERWTLAEFGRSAQRIADDLMALAALPGAARMEPDAYSWEEIRQVADTLWGMALRCALEVDDRALLTELTGPTLRGPGPLDHLARGDEIVSGE